MLKVSPDKTTDLIFTDATALAVLIRTKQVSSVEVVQAHLDRIAVVDSQLNAIVTLMADDAIQAAKAADAAVFHGDPIGPLHSVPFTIKDTLDTAGVLTMRGSRLFKEHIPTRDAVAVTRFKQAGAIPLAKTNVPEFGAWAESDNLVTGRVNNPWNLDRTAGGSSGGEGAAIAAGLSPIGIGSDVAISIRGPAAWNGIAGLKATHGRIPYTGHWPTDALKKFWHVGPMARSITDLATAYDILKGSDDADGYSVYARDAVAADRSLPGKPLRVGWLVEPGLGPVDREVAAAVTDAASALATFGCTVEEVRIPLLEQNDYNDHFAPFIAAEMVPSLRPFIGDRLSELHPVAAAIATMPAPSAADYVAAVWRIDELRSAFATYFSKYDVLLLPTIVLPAPPHHLPGYSINGEKVSSSQTMRATLPFNLSGLPALSVPWRFNSDELPLPIGVQLVSRWLDEATILRLGLLLETISTVHGIHPSL